MCTSPKYITNRSLHYSLYQPLKLKVPCGKCEECKSVNRNEWFIRCVSEWKNNGYKNVYFYTLTYNQEHIPLYDNLPGFSKRDIQLFLKRLRFRLYKYGLTCKYLVTCEFGELKGRSHYHVLFFLSQDINPYWFFKFVQDSWIDQNGKSIGFVKPGDNVGVVNSSRGIQYVVKYITKDYSHVDLALPYFAPKVLDRYIRLFNYIMKRWDVTYPFWLKLNEDYSFSVVWNEYSCDDDVQELAKSLVRKMRAFMTKVLPFHMQSSRLGACLVDVPVLKDEKIPYLDSRSNIRYYKLPRYIKRLLWYDVFENERDGKKTLFRLNEDGKKHVFEKLDYDIQQESTRLGAIILNSHQFDPGLLTRLQKKGYAFKSWNDIVFWCQHLDLDLEVLSIYSRVFRGRVCPFDSDVSLDALTIKDSWKDYAWYCIDGCSNLDLGEIYKNRSLVTYFNSLMWNLHPYFQPYEYALCILEEMGEFIRLGQTSACASLEKKVRKCRQYFNFII